jgi:aminobenzoyl-glutamate transport protein
MSNESSLLYRFLARVERAGNALPHPALMFLFLMFVVIVLSAVFSLLGITALHPVSQETLTAVNLFSAHGLRTIITDLGLCW